MSKKFQCQKQALLVALMETFGNVSAACKIAKVDRTTFYEWKRTDEEFRDQYEGTEYAEIYKDMIEEKLSELAIEKDKTVLIFLAKTKCKDRGYIETVETKELNPQVLVNVVKNYPDPE